MNFKEYALLSANTNLKDSTVDNDLEHTAYGLMTEIGELVDALKRERFYNKKLDLVNVVEEVGDVYWYLALGYLALEKIRGQVVDMDQHEALMQNDEFVDLRKLYDLSDATAKQRALVGVLSVGMREASSMLEIIITSPIDTSRIMEILLEVSNSLNFFCLLQDLSVANAREANIKKLKARYPEGFSTQKALNRDLDAEREVLEAAEQ
jgi:NTP pyrophosphatase (non-canonical NTP hydrolase)